jgi:hypothetical protein
MNDQSKGKISLETDHVKRGGKNFDVQSHREWSSANARFKAGHVPTRLLVFLKS